MAEENGIAFTADFHYPESGTPEVLDISILLINALSNAIEGAKTAATPYVTVSARMNRNVWLLEVRNSFSGSLIFDEESGLPETGKGNRDVHGYGLSNIRHVTKKYFGTMELKQEGGEVILTAMLLTKS